MKITEYQSTRLQDDEESDRNRCASCNDTLFVYMNPCVHMIMLAAVLVNGHPMRLHYNCCPRG